MHSSEPGNNSVLRHRINVMRYNQSQCRISVNETFISANCKRKMGYDGCVKCTSLKCSCECHRGNRKI